MTFANTDVADDEGVVFREHFDVPKEELWEAISDPEQLSSWLGGRCTLEPEVGGEIRFAFHRFLHNDLHVGNLMASGPTHIAVIDWGDAGWGDPAKEASNLPVEAVDDFLAGYREVMPFDGDSTVDDRVRWDRIVDALVANGTTNVKELAAILGSP